MSSTVVSLSVGSPQLSHVTGGSSQLWDSSQESKTGSRSVSDASLFMSSNIVMTSCVVKTKIDDRPQWCDIWEAMTPEEVGRRIAEARNRADLKQETLAVQVGISRQYLSEIERGLSSPTIDLLVKLAKHAVSNGGIGLCRH